MTDYQRIILVHYHEIGLKGHNRAWFNARAPEEPRGAARGLSRGDDPPHLGRICVFLREGTGWDTAVEASEAARGVPGVARVLSGFKCERDLDVMVDAAERAMREAGEFASFKVAARRNHTDFAVGSMDMNRIIGAKLCAAFPEAEVRMKGPDLMVGVEVVQNASYVYARSRPGIGGLPVGSSGTVMCLLSSGIDSPVALWRLARRGAVCVGVRFSGRPQTSDESEYLVDDIAHVLERTGCVGASTSSRSATSSARVSLLAPPSLRVILYRRLMFKVTERLRCIRHAGLRDGESLGQVASQTLENIRATDAAVGLPVFRPLWSAPDKLEIIAQAEELGTSPSLRRTRPTAARCSCPASRRRMRSWPTC